MKVELQQRLLLRPLEKKMELAREWQRQKRKIQDTFGISAEHIPSFPSLPEGFEPGKWHPLVVLPQAPNLPLSKLFSGANIEAHYNLRRSSNDGQAEPYVVFAALEGYEKLAGGKLARNASVEELAAFVLHHFDLIHPGQHIYLTDEVYKGKPHYFKDNKTEGNFKVGAFTRYSSDDRTLRILEVSKKSSSMERVIQKGIQTALAFPVRKRTQTAS